MKIKFLLTIFVGIALAVTAGILIHRKRLPGASEYRDDNQGGTTVQRELYDVSFWFMPIGEQVTYITPLIEAKRPSVDDPLFEKFQSIGMSFGKGNNIASLPPWCFLTCDHDANIIGFTLLPSNHLWKDDCFSRGIEGVNKLSKPISHRGYEFGGVVTSLSGAQVTVRSLESLRAVKSLEYIDFGVSCFDAQVWTELGNVAASTNLRGLVVFQSRSFFSQRGGLTVPQITGIVVHWEDSRILDDIDQAFPNLEFLCLCLPNDDCLRFVFDKSTGIGRLGKLRALRIVSSARSGGHPDDSQPNLPFSRSFLPPNLEYICLDGSLLSRGNMQRYDEFGRTAQLSIKKVGPDKYLERPENLDVVFSSYGFAGGGARSVNANEYQSMNQFWRMTRERK